jgi:hypothetical protein
MRMFFPLVLVACSFNASSEVTDSGGGQVDPAKDAANSDSGETTDTEDTGEQLPDYLVDDDKDGYTENEGDCDDTDRDVHPGAVDTCDGVDSDCDGTLDEDSASDDSNEPNDDQPTYLGSLEDSKTLSSVGILHNDHDMDRYKFGLFDSGFSSFTLTMTLSNIPADGTYLFSFNRLTSEGDQAPGQVEKIFGANSLTLIYEDVFGKEDGGAYELTVESISGADCAQSYALNVVLDG